MPIYVFRCEDCGEKFDRLQKLSDADPDTCPTCGKHRVRRQLTAPAFRLAGSGWYETDFKSDKEKKHNLAGHDEPPSKPSGDVAKTADKAAAGEKSSSGGGDAGTAKSAEPKAAAKSAASKD
ncbi:MAG: FmdB family zinc ribbon protein [Rhodanobacteraceae bacterium]